MGASWCHTTRRDVLDVSTDAQDRHGFEKLAPISRLAFQTGLTSFSDRTAYSHPGFCGMNVHDQRWRHAGLSPWPAFHHGQR